MRDSLYGSFAIGGAAATAIRTRRHDLKKALFEEGLI
jgi:hypothetical protein